LFFALLFLFSAGLFAQKPPAKPSSNGRYLFILDTSSATKRYSEGVEQMVWNLFSSGMNGELHPGDTLGVWLFNEQLYRGRFPLQRWSAGGKSSVLESFGEFFKTLSYEKNSRFGVVTNELKGIVADSEMLTVLIFTTGEQKITGTPYDSLINSFFEQYSRDQKKARVPFLVVLRAKHGHFVGFTVNQPQTGFEFPAFPPDPKPVQAEIETPKSNASPPVVKAAPPPVAPLIVSGKISSLDYPGLSPEAMEAAILAAAATNSPTQKVAVTITSPPPAIVKTSPPPHHVASQNGIKPQDGVSNTLPTNTAVPKVVATVAPEPKKIFQRKGFWIWALVLAGIISGLILFWRTSHPSRPGSLISQSLDRDKR
jgi:hypothetical protein